jgi:hypothetical protein
MWGEDIYDKFSNEKDARYVIEKYSYKYPKSSFRLIKEICIQEYIDL